MQSEEFIELRNRFILGLVVVLIFIIPLTFVFINKFGIKSSNILKSINKKEDLIVLVTSSDCSVCNKVQKVLKDRNVDYSILNKDKEDRYLEILKKMGLSASDIEAPTIVYLEDGKLYSFLVSANEETTREYISFNNLGKNN